MSERDEQTQEALRLAGRLASAAYRLLMVPTLHASGRIAALDKALGDYNRYILEWSTREMDARDE